MKPTIPKRFAFKEPLMIQAPMAGGISTPALVAAVSEQGGLGSFATGYLTPEQVVAGLKEITLLTSRPFAVNLFIPALQISTDPKKLNTYQAKIHGYEAELGISSTTTPCRPQPDYFLEMVNILIFHKLPIVSFTFGNLSTDLVEKFHRAGTYLIGTATSLEEATILAESDIDAIVLQGAEAGGHRGGFLANHQGLINTMPLVEQIAHYISDRPLLAAGGIMSGLDIAKVIKLGASGVQMGTAFLNTQESGASSAYKNALLECRTLDYDPTCLTQAFSGKFARGISNRFTEEMKNMPIPEYPIPHWISAPMRRQANLDGKTEYMSMWAGQGVRAIRKELSVSSLIQQLRRELV
jgi:nitronate monooxygenase